MKRYIIREIVSIILMILKMIAIGITCCFLYSMGRKAGENYQAGKVENAAGSEAVMYTEADKIANNMDILYKLRDDVWDTIDSESEKIEILQAVANAEGRFLGLSDRLTVEAADLGDVVHGTTRNTWKLGTYVDSKKMIYINERYLVICSGWDAVWVILHECRHSWQYQIAQMYASLSEADRQLVEIRKYEKIYHGTQNVIGSEDFLNYWNSDIEVDARQHAYSGLLDYQDIIAKYVQEKGE